ncbi:hypothetical protein ACFXTI_014334 [Malus domestica]
MTGMVSSQAFLPTIRIRISFFANRWLNNFVNESPIFEPEEDGEIEERERADLRWVLSLRRWGEAVIRNDTQAIFDNNGRPWRAKNDTAEMKFPKTCDTGDAGESVLFSLPCFSAGLVWAH